MQIDHCVSLHAAQADACARTESLLHAVLPCDGGAVLRVV